MFVAQQHQVCQVGFIMKRIEERVEGDPVALRAAEVHIGNVFTKRILMSYTGVPMVQDGFFDFQGVAASVGDLPIRPKILDGTTSIQDTFAKLFSRFSHEHKLLDQLASISVNNKRILLTYKPKSSTH